MSNQQPNIEQQLFQQRIKEFEKDLELIQEKHGVVVTAGLDLSKLQMGIIPQVIYLDKRKVDAAMAKEGNFVSSQPTQD